MKMLRKLFVIAFLVSITVLLISVPAQAHNRPICQRVVASGAGQDNGDGTTQARITGYGLLLGTTTASFVPTGQTGNVLSIAGTVTFTTYHATLSVTVTGTFDLTSGAFTTSGPVTAATGLLSHTSGNLTLAGVESLTDGSFTERITGQLCVS